MGAIDKLKDMTPQKLKNYKHFLTSQFFKVYYGDPSSKLAVIGVTGTDGKTTTCTLIYEILRHAGYKVGLVTTISARIGDESIPTGFHVTTPSPKQLQALLKRMVDSGLEFVILETTSHGLDQYRIGGIQYHAGIFTNVSHEHLDYHKTYEAYLDTKAKMINLISPGGFVVINKDDKSAPTLISKAKDHMLKTYTYGFTKESNMYASDYQDKVTHTSFKIRFGEKEADIDMHLPGEYNVYNALGAIQVALEIGVKIEDITEGIKNVTSLEGRWEVIQKEPVKIVVDFAHTPNSLEKMLQYAKQDNQLGRVILVFGAAGKRDFEKRAMMGAVAAKYADITILTAEDPRGESVGNINRQIAMGLTDTNKVEGKDFYSHEDRRSAIAFAIKLAQKGDTIVITGKGHEKSMNLDGENELPWSDQVVVKELLELK